MVTSIHSMCRSLGLPKGDLPIQEIQHPASRFVSLYYPLTFGPRLPDVRIDSFQRCNIPAFYHPPIAGYVQDRFSCFHCTVAHTSSLVHLHISFAHAGASFLPFRSSRIIWVKLLPTLITGDSRCPSCRSYFSSVLASTARVLRYSS